MRKCTNKIAVWRTAGLLTLLLSSSATASNLQSFIGINYSNPADLPLLVKDTEIIIGNYYVIPSVKFNGTVAVADPFGVNNITDTGSTKNTTNSNYNLPYGRYAKRINKQFVVGIDITQPFKSFLQYANDSLVRYAVTANNIQTIDFAPNLAYQFCGPLEKLSIGVGLNIARFDADLTQQFPSLTVPFGSAPDATISNHALAWTYGGHLGATYHLFEGTLLGLSYYSQLSPIAKGTSGYTGFPNNTHLRAVVNLPATTTLAFTQYFREDWPVQLQLHYTQWNRLKRVFINNTSGPTISSVLNFDYKNTWEVDLGTRLDIMPKVILGGFISYDQTPTNTIDRTLGLPEVNQVTLSFLAGYKITKSTTLELSYAHVFMVSSVPLNNFDANTGVTTVGNAHVYGDLVGLQMTMDV